MKPNEVIKVKVKSSSKGELIEDLKKIIPVGRGYLHQAIDESFTKHQVGDSYKLELSVKEAYGQRRRELIRMVPTRFFKQNQVNPVKGLVVNVDGLMGKIISASPGRVMVDFNHPLAGKPMTFEVKIEKKITDSQEIAESIIKSMIGRELVVKVKEKSIVINDTIGLPKNIKERVEKELVEVLKKDVSFEDKHEGN